MHTNKHTGRLPNRIGLITVLVLLSLLIFMPPLQASSALDNQLLEAAQAERVNIKLIESLIAKGADVNAQATPGAPTARIYAAQVHEFYLIGVLQLAGADINIQADHGTALVYAVETKGVVKTYL